MKINKKDVGERISTLRKQHNLTMNELAKIAKVGGRSTVNGWEKGRSIPPQNSLDKMSSYFKVTPAFLLYGSLKKYVFDLLINDVTFTEDRFDDSESFASLIITASSFADYKYPNDGLRSGMKKAINYCINYIYPKVVKNNLSYGDDTQIEEIAAKTINEALKKDFEVEKNISSIKRALDECTNVPDDNEEFLIRIKKNGLNEFLHSFKEARSINDLINEYYNFMIRIEMNKFKNKLDKIDSDYKTSLNKFQN